MSVCGGEGQEGAGKEKQYLCHHTQWHLSAPLSSLKLRFSRTCLFPIFFRLLWSRELVWFNGRAQTVGPADLVFLSKATT